MQYIKHIRAGAYTICALRGCSGPVSARLRTRGMQVGTTKSRRSTSSSASRSSHDGRRQPEERRQQERCMSRRQAGPASGLRVTDSHDRHAEACHTTSFPGRVPSKAQGARPSAPCSPRAFCKGTGPGWPGIGVRPAEYLLNNQISRWPTQRRTQGSREKRRPKRSSDPSAFKAECAPGPGGVLRNLITLSSLLSSLSSLLLRCVLLSFCIRTHARARLESYSRRLSMQRLEEPSDTGPV